MPIYEYVCDDCQHPFEKLVMKSREKIVCPKCGGRHHSMQYSVIAAPAKGGDGASAAEFSEACQVPGGGGCGGCPPGGCGCH